MRQYVTRAVVLSLLLAGDLLPVSAATPALAACAWVEWADVERLLVDPAFDAVPPNNDLRAIKAVNNDEFLCMRLRFREVPTRNTFLVFNTDNDARTGCEGQGIGYEAGLVVFPTNPEASYIGNAEDCGFEPTDFPGALQAAIDGRIIVVAVPLWVLESLTPDLHKIVIGCDNDRCTPTEYKVQ